MIIITKLYLIEASKISSILELIQKEGKMINGLIKKIKNG